MTVFIDVDKTLADAKGNPLPVMLAAVRQAVAGGHEVVLWSRRGTVYAAEFAQRNGLAVACCVGKPDAYVDDHPDLRMRYLSPDTFRKHGLKC